MATLPKDVLIVEDDPFIALDVEEMVLRLGVKSTRTASNVASALDMIADRAPDLALLDVGLLHESSLAVAEKLAMLQVPFVFVTAYDDVPRAFADRPRLPKPCSRQALDMVLERHGGARG
jgi:two-component SAPR family response regulator